MGWGIKINSEIKEKKEVNTTFKKIGNEEADELLLKIKKNQERVIQKYKDGHFNELTPEEQDWMLEELSYKLIGWLPR